MTRRSSCWLLVAVAAFGCGGTSPDGGVDGGTDGGGTDAGPVWASCLAARPACDLLGTWTLAWAIDAGSDGGTDAGSVRPCYGIPARVAANQGPFTLATVDGGWCSRGVSASWAEADAGCTLRLWNSWPDGNPYEPGTDWLQFWLTPSDAGVMTGPGRYGQGGLFLCELPLSAEARR